MQLNHVYFHAVIFLVLILKTSFKHNTMATIYHDAQEIYTLKSELNGLTISVEIGDGQSGGYFIFNDTKLVSSNNPADIYKGADCFGNWITVVTAIKGKLTETNWTSISIIFKEQGEKMVVLGPYNREVDRNLDTIVYTIKIKVN